MKDNLIFLANLLWLSHHQEGSHKQILSSLFFTLLTHKNVGYEATVFNSMSPNYVFVHCEKSSKDYITDILCQKNHFVMVTSSKNLISLTLRWNAIHDTLNTLIVLLPLFTI